MLCYQNKIIPYLDFLSSIILLRFIFNRWCDFILFYFILFFTMQCQSFISVRKETKPFWCWRYTWSKQQIEKKKIDEDSEFFKFWQEWARITNIKQYQNRWHWLYSNMELSSIKDFHNFKKSMSALHQKSYFPLKFPPVNVTKSAGNCGFGHIYWRNPLGRILTTPQKLALFASLKAL